MDQLNLHHGQAVSGNTTAIKPALEASNKPLAVVSHSNPPEYTVAARVCSRPSGKAV